MKTVKTFEVSGLIICCQRRSRERCKQQIAWSKWRETTEVMFDSNIPTKLKDKVYKTAIKPAMVNGPKCCQMNSMGPG